MKKQELVEIIRTLVKEEVNSVLPQLLMEVLAEKITQNQSALLETSKSAASPSVVTKKPTIRVGLDAPLKQSPAPTLKTFSTKPNLNQVLNETVGGVP